MRFAYKTINFRNETLLIIHLAEKIIQEYEADGINMTVRQLYYQFIARNLFPPSWVDPVYNAKKGLAPDTKNTEKNYKRLAGIVNNARLAGHISWTSIEDRTRSLKGLAHWDSPAEIIEAAADQFRLDKWEGQENRVEVWVEKDALIGVIEGVCHELDVPFFACRGYVSASELWVASQRLIAWEEKGYETIVLHLGDHDPSGIDMTRDIADRLDLFDCLADVKRIALTMEQINALKPPPDPAKISDSRFEKYAARYGTKSWELDALDPKYLIKLIRNNVTKYRQAGNLKAVVSKENRMKKRMNQIVKQLLKEFKK